MALVETGPDAADARRLWTLLEPVHAVTYFAPEARDAFEGAGLRGFWRGYFAGRAAPLGTVGPDLVTALFYNFAPRMVGRALPDVWTRVTPVAALEARLAGALATLRWPVTTRWARDTVAENAALLARCVRETDLGGRPLAAANAAAAVQGDPDDPLGALWAAATFWREYRGDSHVAVLVSEGIDGLSAHVLRDAADGSRKLIQPNRGWTDEEWAAAERGLRARGLLDRPGGGSGGGLTQAGADLVEHIERRTDQTSATLVAALSGAERERLARGLTPLARALVPAVVPYPNPTGAARP